MAVSESKKKANMKWDSANMSTLACKVKKEQAEQFKTYCASVGETVNAVLQDYVAGCINGEIPTQNPAGAVKSVNNVLTPSALKTAQKAAQSAGETVPVFVERAVNAQSQRDQLSQRLKPKE